MRMSTGLRGDVGDSAGDLVVSHGRSELRCRIEAWCGRPRTSWPPMAGCVIVEGSRWEEDPSRRSLGGMDQKDPPQKTLQWAALVVASTGCVDDGRIGGGLVRISPATGHTAWFWNAAEATGQGEEQKKKSPRRAKRAKQNQRCARASASATSVGPAWTMPRKSPVSPLAVQAA